MTANMLPCTVVEPVLSHVTRINNTSDEQGSNKEQCCNDNVKVIFLKPFLLETILSSHRVKVPPGVNSSDHMASFNAAIESLKLLIVELKSIIESGAQIDKRDSSPGFMTANHNGTWVHHTQKFFGRYETLADVLLFPMPSPSVALHCFSQILHTWKKKKVIENLKPFKDDLSVCSCFDAWQHCPKKDVMMELVNHTLEQLMTHEADQSLRHHFTHNVNIHEWNNNFYTPESCPAPQQLTGEYTLENAIQLISDRDQYALAYCNAVLAAHCTIDLNLCYIFPFDPLHRYILLDLLPYVAKKKNVQVRIICDTITMGSMLLKSAFEVDKTLNVSSMNKEQTHALKAQQMSFLNCLPPHSPPFHHAKKEFSTVLSFLKELNNIASTSVPDNLLQFKWWCARDAKMKYPIKSHIKCHIFDGHVVICGGSNVAPIVGNIDCDIHLAGPAAEKYQQFFNDLWYVSTSSISQFDKKNDERLQIGNCVEPEKIVVQVSEGMTVTPSKEISESAITTGGDLVSLGTTITLDTVISSLSLDVSSHSQSSDSSTSSSAWTDDTCSIAVVQSCPGSDGEDAILRHVLGAISTAKKSIAMCMGHSNVPMAMAQALAAATERGVEVKFTVNSWYSSDLRCGQRDLFISLKKLKLLAPKVHVYVTALASQTKQRQNNKVDRLCGYQDGDNKAEFLHSKFIVVDSHWSAVGSWNMWTRGSFYEMDLELFVFSEILAKKLEEKFECERKNHTLELQGVEDCNFFCPKGCELCETFGPFFVHDRK